METRNEIVDKLTSLINTLIENIAKQIITNQISDNITFTLEIGDKDNWVDESSQKRKLELLKAPKILFKDLSEAIYKNQEDLNVVDLLMLYSTKDETIIRCVLFKAHEPDFPKYSTTYHCSIRTPSEWQEDEKFDLHFWMNEKNMLE